MRIFIIIFFIFILKLSAFAQCCSPGNPVGGTTNIGILDKNALRFISFYRFSFSEGYFQGNKKSEYNLVKNGNFNYAGFVLGYGLLNKLTIETELGYFINKTQTYNVVPSVISNGFGLNNAILSLKYNLISKTEKSFEWTFGAGAKIPFTKNYLMVDNAELPKDVQPSTHAFGIVAQSFLYKGIPGKKMKLFFINRFENNFPDIKNYQYGDVFISSFFITKQFGNSNWTTILQTRHEWRDQDIVLGGAACPTCLSNQGTRVSSSGGNLFFIAPQINYTIAKKWNVSLLVDLPVYRYYNGTQLGNKFAFAFYLSRDFGGKCVTK